MKYPLTFIALLALTFVILGTSGVNAADACNLKATLINQDPIKAVPGEYVKVVFQLTGVENSNCGDVTFEPVEEFPFTLDPGMNKTISIKSGTYISTGFNPFLMVPYKLRVSKDAISGEVPFKVKYLSQAKSISTIQEFNITIENVQTDFEVSIRDYVPSQDSVVFDILNTGEFNAEAVTVEIPKQENIQVKGANRNIVGALDQNEDTTFNFEAVPKEGPITLKISYTDTINERRTVEKSVNFDPSYYTGRIRDQVPAKPTWYYPVLVIIAALIIWWIIRRIQKKRKKKN